MKRQIYLIFLLALFLVILPACSTGACFEETIPKVNAGIYNDTTGVARQCDSIMVTALAEAKDTIIVNKKNASSFSFCLDPVHNNAMLLFRIDKTTDTVTFTYTSYPHVISPECGYTVFNNITSVISTHHIIDTITIVNKSITLNGQRNICIYY